MSVAVENMKWLEQMQLSPVMARLRDEALRPEPSLSATNSYSGPSGAEVEADAWRSRAAGEDWLVWRARKCAAVLAHMPIAVSDGELVVGRTLDTPGWNAAPESEDVKAILSEIPPSAGGDTGHFHPDYEKVFRVGIRGILSEIDERRQSVESEDKRAFYDACEIALRAVSDYARRVGQACRSNGSYEIAAMCERVATEPPATFHEAVELMFLLIVCLWFAEDHYMTTPGRMDQTLRRFYEADLQAGRLSRDGAFEIICGLFIQCNMILDAGAAISVMVGGRDRNGQDVTNDLTYLCLQARLATHLVYPTVAIAWHEGTPAELMDFGCRMLATGIGDPAFFNDEVIAQGLRDHGVSDADSHDYMNSTCVEIKVVGASNIWVAWPYINLPECILDVMEGALDVSDFVEFNSAVKACVAQKIGNVADYFDSVWWRRETSGGYPLASCFTNDCLERGLDFDRGGARYNWVENAFVGLANLIDGLAAVRYLVYETGDYSLSGFREILKTDYEDKEDLRQRILRDVPSYGTDSDEADSLAVEWADYLQSETESHQVGLHRYVPGFFCWIMHGIYGQMTGATPDGRKSGVAFADGAAAAQGRETAGPTASILSTTKWSHRRALGGLVHNTKFSKSLMNSESGLSAVRAIVETYLHRGGFEIQVNVVSADTLRDAQTHPENYRDLVVRVAGYSDYFTHLSPEMQEEVIARNEHDLG